MWSLTGPPNRVKHFGDHTAAHKPADLLSRAACNDLGWVQEDEWGLAAGLGSWARLQCRSWMHATPRKYMITPRTALIKHAITDTISGMAGAAGERGPLTALSPTRHSPHSYRVGELV